MLVKIADEFNLEHIAESGQVFRCARLTDGWYRFIAGRRVLRIRNAWNGEFTGSCGFEASCGADDWEAFWSRYFDLERDYRSVRRDIIRIIENVPDPEAYGPGLPFLREAVTAGEGLRILRQDPWETLVSFIFSQRKSIPAIKTCVERFAARYGEPVTDGGKKLYLFPQPSECATATEEELAKCGPGYRAGYVLSAIEEVCSGRLSLVSLYGRSDERLLESLMTVRGVGEKVAACVALFAYGRTGLVPRDVWIKKFVTETCAGRDPFPLFGELAGVVQQYVFLHMRRGRISAPGARAL